MPLPLHAHVFLTALLILLCFSNEVNAGNVTLTNTYPVPNGDYQNLFVSNNLGIGTTVPTAQLDINGQIKISGGTPGTDKVLTSSADGTATWETTTGGTIGLGACVDAAGPGCTNHATQLNACPASNPALIGVYTQYISSGCEGEFIERLRCCALVVN